MSEAVLQDRLTNWFGKWFDVYFEEWSLCRTKRIDLILFHCSDKAREYPIGIEIKKGHVKKGADIAKWCNQAREYRDVLFFEKKAHIFIAPQISGWYLDEGQFVKKHNVEAFGSLGCQHNINSFLYRSFGIGELQKYKRDLRKNADAFRLTMNTKEIWNSTKPYTFNTEILDKL
jgi:hypothetical protein